MLDYRVRFTSGRSSESVDEVGAPDASAALVLAQRFGNGRRTELWQGDRMICQMSHTSEGFWEVC